MNRRELFQGLAASLALAGMPFASAVVEYGDSPALQALDDTEMINYLRKVRAEIIEKLINPPMVLDGSIIRKIDQPLLEETLTFVNQVLEELEMEGKK